MKNQGIFGTVYFVRNTFLNICVLSQCIVYRIHFQNIHTFTYQKNYFIKLLYHVQYEFQSESTLYSLAKWLSVRLQTK